MVELEVITLASESTVSLFFNCISFSTFSQTINILIYVFGHTLSLKRLDKIFAVEFKILCKEGIVSNKTFEWNCIRK